MEYNYSTPPDTRDFGIVETEDDGGAVQIGYGRDLRRYAERVLVQASADCELDAVERIVGILRDYKSLEDGKIYVVRSSEATASGVLIEEFV